MYFFIHIALHNISKDNLSPSCFLGTTNTEMIEVTIDDKNYHYWNYHYWLAQVKQDGHKLIDAPISVKSDVTIVTAAV